MTQSVENINRNNMKAMNLMRLVVPTLLFAVGVVASAQNTTPKYDENALTIPKTIEVIDTAKAVATANSIKTSAKARCNSLRNELEIIEGMGIIGTQLDAKGKELLMRLVKDKSVTIALGYSQKQHDKIVKKAEKGKVKKQMIPYIEYRRRDIVGRIDILEEICSSDFWRIVRPLPTKEITVQTPNPYNRARSYKSPSTLDLLDKTAQMSGWEWTASLAYTVETSPSPYYLPLKIYPGHDQYRICDNYVYDQKGNLVRVLTLLRNDDGTISDELKEDLTKKLYIQDYKNNKYGIRSASEDVHYAIRNRLGLSDESKRKTSQQTSDLVSAGVGYLFSGSKRKQDRYVEDGVSVFLDMLGEQSRLYNSEAEKFLEQIKKDHEDDFAYTYKIERTGDKSFSITFLDDRKSASCVAEISFHTSSPYKVEQKVTVRESPKWKLPYYADMQPEPGPSSVRLDQVYQKNESITNKAVMTSPEAMEYLNYLKSKR